MPGSARSPSATPQFRLGPHECRDSENPDAESDLLDELLDLEADYQSTLTSLLERVSPVLEASNTLTAGRKQTLFSNLKELQAFSSLFLEDLSRIQLPEHRERFAPIIQDALERSADAYDLYYRRYALTADVVCQLTAEPQTSALLKRLFSADRRIWPLNAAFGKPLQIIFSYKLLIFKFIDLTSYDAVLSTQLSTVSDFLDKYLEMVYSARQAALDWEAMRNFEKELDISKLRDPKNHNIRLDRSDRDWKMQSRSRSVSLLTSLADADELVRRRMVTVESFTEVGSLYPMLSRRTGPRTQLSAIVRPRGRLNLHLFTDVLVVVRPMSRAEVMKRADNKTGYLLWVPLRLTDVEVGQYQYSADENIDIIVDGQLALVLQASSFAAKENWLSEFTRLKEAITERTISQILTAMSSATLPKPTKRHSDGGDVRCDENEVGSPRSACRKHVGGGGWISGMRKAILHGGKDAKSKPETLAAQPPGLFQHRVGSSPSLASALTNTAVKSTDLLAPPLSATFPLITRLFNAKGASVEQPPTRTSSPSMVVSMPVSLPGSHGPPLPRSSSRAAPLAPASEVSRMSANNSIVGLVCRTGNCAVSVWREPVWQSFKGGRSRVEVKRTAVGRACLVATIMKKPKEEAHVEREADAKDVSLAFDSWRSSQSNSSVVTTAHRPGRCSVATEQDDDDENERQVLNAWIEPSTEAAIKEPATVLVWFALNGGRTARYMIECASEADARNLFESVRGQVVLATLATEEETAEDLEEGSRLPSFQRADLPASSLPSPQRVLHGPNDDSSTLHILCSTPVEGVEPAPSCPFVPDSPSSTTTCFPQAAKPRVRLLESRCKLYVLCDDPEYWSPLGRGLLTVSASQSGRDYHVTVAADSDPLVLEVPCRSAVLEDWPTSSSQVGTAGGEVNGVLRRLGNGRFTITVRQVGRRAVYLVVYTETPDSYDVLWRKVTAVV